MPDNGMQRTAVDSGRKREEHDIDYDLTCWYLNVRRAVELVGAEKMPRLGYSNPIEKVCVLASIKDAILAWANESPPPTLGQLLVADKLREGVLFSHCSNYYCRGLFKWNAWRGGGPAPSDLPEISSKLNGLLHGAHIQFSYHPEHLVSTSSWFMLTGSQRLLVLGLTQKVSGGAIEGLPYVIATPHVPFGRRASVKGTHWSNSLEVHPSQIDQFSKINDERQVSEGELKILKSLPEKQIKSAFAELIGESHVPKDWSGEKSDLFSTYVTIGGRRISTAFAFKGPARFKPLTLAGLGKNGDQIDRLFSEPADLLVLQHCHRIMSPIRSTMRAYASRIGDIRNFCLVDGRDTLRLLRAYRKCGL